MAQFLRGKQAGIQNDLSAGIRAENFALDDLARYGVNSQISTLAYDPVQSLLAVGTNESPYGSGQVYLFGQKRVTVTLSLPKKASVRILQFCADKLVVLDSKDTLTVYSLLHKRLLSTHTPPGLVTSLLTDPSLDWAFLGLHNGDIMAYDLDQARMAPWQIPCFWKERNPRARSVPVVSLALHPRDVGSLLIGYSEGAVIFSFKQAIPTKFFHYELPPGAPGGDSDPSSVNNVRRPKLTQALWHPTGTFIMTGHEDSSLVVWDPNDKAGRILMARTLQDTNVDKPGSASGSYGATPGTFSLKEPIFRIAWCCKNNPDDTALLVAGGAPTSLPTKGLTFFELGPTPNYATATWETLSAHFDTPKRQRILPTPPQAEVVDFCLIPRASPFFAGAQDPIAVIALLSSGELVTLSFPSGHPISPTNQLHLSLSFVHPFVNKLDVAVVERNRWLELGETRDYGPPILKGGAEGILASKRHLTRNIVQTAHADGTIRLWDAGHGDEIEMGDVLQVDVARALGRTENVAISKLSMSGITGELAVGLFSGEVLVFRWDRNQLYGREEPPGSDASLPEGLSAIKDRADPSCKLGLMPLTALNERHGIVTSLKMSDVGFVCMGYEDGNITVIDLRGPAVIYSTNLADGQLQSKRSSKVIGKRSSAQTSSRQEWPTTIEFGVMSLENDDYSSILLFVGTNLGRIATFKVLPSADGRYTVQFAGISSLESSILSVAPINAISGNPANATPSAVAKLRDGVQTNGVVVVTSQTEVRIFKPAAAKGAHKSWDEFSCESATVAHYEGHGHALVTVMDDGSARAFSIPALREISAISIRDKLDIKKLADARITTGGDIVAWTGPSEITILNVWGTGLSIPSSLDKLLNPESVIPARPTISNLQWIAGTQHVTPADLDILIGGPDRKPIAREAPAVDASGKAIPPSAAAANQEGYWAYMQRQMQERTENLNLLGDSMNNVQKNSEGWASDVGKFVNKQKRGMVTGAIKSKFGF